MKTLGQILIDEISSREWLREPATTWRLESWEAAAQAVRLAVIEECARVCMGVTVVPEQPSRAMPLWCADAIRSLKDKP